MNFKQAIEVTPGLENAYMPGLRALRSADRPHIDPAVPRCLTGSVDIDSALQRIEPHANRWDFAIAYKHANRTAEYVYWVELHTASDSEVKVVIKKALWLQTWLKMEGKPLSKFECEIVWVSSGATTFTLSAPQKKQMAQAGLRHRGSRLRILERRND